MPKQTIKIKDFAGGLNELQDPRDIGPNQFAELDSVNIDDPGRIRLSGGIVANGGSTGYAADYTADNSAMSSDKQLLGFVHPGHGLYQTTSDVQVLAAVDDYRDAHEIDDQVVSSETIAQVANQITLLGNSYTGSGAQNTVALYDHNADLWHLTGIDISHDTASASELSKPLIYNLNGGIRACESNFDLTGGDSKVLQYIKRTHFDDGTAGNSFNGWFTCNQEISNNPEKTGMHARATAETTDLTVQLWTAGGSAPSNTQTSTADVNIWFVESANANAFGWNNAVTGVNWQAGISYVYDDGQESPLKISSTTIGIQAAHNVSFRAYFSPETGSGASAKCMNPRLKGVNLYVKGSSASSAQSNNWFLAGVFEFENGKGGKRPQDDGWGDWTGSSDDFYANTDTWASPPSVETFRTRTGRRVNEAVHARYKCAVEARGRMYIGNVMHADDAGASETVYPDRMLKSKRVNGKVSPDIFPASEMVELANNDGEEITHLAYFMGKLLQFKQNTLYVINITGAAEALESTHKHLGITHPSQVCTTASGVAWVCEKGIMLYNGQSITNLIDGKISTSVWNAFFDLDNIPSIAYDANDAKAIISRGSDEDVDKDIYIFDLKLKAFIYKKDGLNVSYIPDSYLSNMITDFNGNIVVYNSIKTGSNTHISAAGSKMYKWDKTPQPSSYFNVVTKDIDFEEPSVKKKVYKLYITYKCTTADTNVIVQYAVNGSKDWKQFGVGRSEDMATGYTTNSVTYAELDGSKSVWTLAELRPFTSSEANNIYSVQIKISAIRSVATMAVHTGGSGYSATTVSPSGGSGEGLSVTTTVSGGNALTGVSAIGNGGVGYAEGDVVDVGGGSGGKLYVASLNTVPADFEINDMSVVYRGKRVK